MKIERVIFVFKKYEDKLVKEIIAKKLNLDVIEGLFKSKEGDPNFYSPYQIEKEQYNELIIYIPELQEYPCEKFELYLEAVSVE